VLERRQKQRQIAASIEFFSRKEMRSSSRAHHQHLVRLQGQYMPTPQPTCNNGNCDNKCLPFSTKCRRHICSDQKQLLYTLCTYVYPSGGQCASPIPLYLTPPLCGGHCDTALSSPPYPDIKNPHETLETTVPKEVVTTPTSEGVNYGVTEKATASDRSTESVLKESSSVGVRMGLVKSEGGEEEPMEVVTEDATDGVVKKDQNGED
jgi:hypothetical protein